MGKILATLSCNLDADILSASLPLLAEERVAALEWSFDTLFNIKEVPAWFDELLHTYSDAGRLIGHGVFFSLFSAKWLPQQQQWLDELRRLSRVFRFDHITEHFGFMTGADFHQGAPMSIPYSATALAIGRDRLVRIQDACGCPVGLENLAFSYSVDEVKQHGVFLEELVAPVNGFIILDLHNLYCQLHNFSIDFYELVSLYPLERVREIHISGGSWETSSLQPDRQVRRDTHDDSVPETVFSLLEKILPLCPALKYVVLEQLGAGLKDEASHNVFYDDFVKMERMIAASAEKRRLYTPQNNFMPDTPMSVAAYPVEDEAFYLQQKQLSAILETATGYEDAMARIAGSSLAGSEWMPQRWQPHMLETAMSIAQKWKKGWDQAG